MLTPEYLTRIHCRIESRRMKLLVARVLHLLVGRYFMICMGTTNLRDLSCWICNYFADRPERHQDRDCPRRFLDPTPGIW
jgi:hypothetical protein